MRGLALPCARRRVRPCWLRSSTPVRRACRNDEALLVDVDLAWFPVAGRQGGRPGAHLTQRARVVDVQHPLARSIHDVREQLPARVQLLLRSPIEREVDPRTGFEARAGFDLRAQ